MDLDKMKRKTINIRASSELEVHDQPTSAQNKHGSYSEFMVIVISCLLQMTFSTMMTITNKELLSSQNSINFPFPTGMVFFQNFVSFVFLRSFAFFGYIELQPIQKERLHQWIPLNLLFISMLTTGSYGLQLLSVPMVTIFKNLQTAVTSFGDWYYFGKTLSIGTLASLFIMIFGAIVAGIHDLEFNFFGYFWIIINCVCGAGYILTTKLVLDTQKMSKIDNINHNCTISLPFLLILIVLNGELFSMINWFATTTLPASFIFLALLNALFAFSISFSSFWVIQTTSPTTFSILGAVNKIPLTIFSIWWFHNVFSPIGGHAVVGSLLGGIVYAISSAYSQKEALIAVYPRPKKEDNEKDLA